MNLWLILDLLGGSIKFRPADVGLDCGGCFVFGYFDRICDDHHDSVDFVHCSETIDG